MNATPDSPFSTAEASPNDPSLNRINAGERHIDSLPLINRVNLGVLNFPNRIATFEFQALHSTKQIRRAEVSDTTQNNDANQKIHVNALVNAILDFCSAVFTGVTHPADSLALVKKIIEHVSPEYHQYMLQILLLYGTYSRNPMGLEGVRAVALKLIEPAFTAKKENIPIFKKVPESAPSAPLSANEKEIKMTSKSGDNETIETSEEAGKAAAAEFMNSLRKNRSQLKMAMDFSEHFRVRVQLQNESKKNRTLIAFCNAMQEMINRENNSFVRIENNQYSVKGLLSALIANVQVALEKGDSLREINNKWHTLAGFSPLLIVATEITLDDSCGIFTVEAGKATEAIAKPQSQNPPGKENSDIFTSALKSDGKTKAASPTGKLPKVDVPAAIVAQAPTPKAKTNDDGEFEVLEETDIEVEEPVHFEPFIEDEVNHEGKTPAEVSEAVRQRVVIDQFTQTQKLVESLNERANTLFHVAQLLDIKSKEVLKLQLFIDDSKKILETAATKVLEADRLSTVLSNAITAISSHDALETIGDVQGEYDQLMKQLDGIDAAFIAFRQKAERYVEYKRVKDEQRRKANEWFESYFGPGLFAAKRGLTYEAITETVYEPIKANVIEPIKNTTRSFLKKLMPYVFAAGSSLFLIGDTPQQKQQQENTLPTPIVSMPTAHETRTIEQTRSVAPARTNTVVKTATREKMARDGAPQSFYFNEIISNSTVFTPEESFKQVPHATGPIDFMGADHGKIVSSHIDAEKTAPSQKIVQLKKGEGLSQSALRMHTELVIQKVTESLASQGISASPLTIAQAVETHMASLKGANSYSLALSYIGSSELNDPLIKQLDTTQSDGHTIVNPRGNVHYQAAENSYAIDLNNPAVRTEIDTSTQKILQSLAPKETGTKSFFNKTASKLGGFVKGLFR